VPNLVDLSLCSDARKSLHRVLDTRGLGFFLARAPRGPARLDNRRIAWVVEAARRRSVRSPRTDDLARTRRVLRRELIRRLTEHMLSCGM
jgi:hypothetical protein